MAVDVPTVVYNHNKEHKPTKAEYEDIMNRWQAKKKEEEENGTRVEKLNLNDFLKGK